jgi:Protein kinase domain
MPPAYLLSVEPLASDDPVEIAGYRLRARLGSGGMGRVYLAFTPAGQAVALKVMRPDLADDADFRRRFRHEADAARRVHGLYTAQVLDADPDAMPPWLVTAYVPGPSLHQAVAEHGPMPEHTVLVLVAGVAEALSAIHAAGVVHRDLKPSNVLLAPDGPKVIDFGIARAADATTLTRTGVRVGSPHFMAPEQVSGTDASPAIDMFALGAVGAFAALGRSPFGEGDELAVLYRVLHTEADLTGCPQSLREVLQRCLAKDPADRPEPAEIIALCRARTAGQPAAGQPAEAAQPWLPPAVADALARHLPPPAPPPPAPPPPAPQAAAPSAQALPAQALPLAALPLGATPAEPSATVTATSLIPAQTQPGRRSRVPGPVLLGGGLAVIGVAALAVVGLLALRGHGGNPSAPSNTLAAVATDQTTGSASGSAGQGPSRFSARPAASASASARAIAKPRPAVDACLVGTWIVVDSDLLNTINGSPVQFTGGRSGDYMIVQADGNGYENFSGEVLSATINGNSWTDVFAGSVTMHVDTDGGSMYFSDVVPSANASQTLYENGSYNNSDPTTLEPGGDRYVCSGNTLRMFWSVGSSVLTRKLP